MTWEEIKDVLIPIGAYILALYGPALKAAVIEVWSASTDPFWWKVRGSLIAAFKAFVPVVKQTWGVYGTIVIALIVKIIKSKLGVPGAVNAMKRR